VTTYLGIDLAWGPHGRTGLAGLDGDGRLVASASVGTDGEIAAFVAAHLAAHPGPVLAAVDAPLVVPNETGRRPCEAELSAAFGRFHAGPHPANRGLPHLREPRGAVLAERFGWTLDPDATEPGEPVPEPGACIEVYPHPAMVTWFDLDRVIPYKHKTGRDLAALQAASTLLLELVEREAGPLLRLSDHPRWQQARTTVAAATRKSHLRSVEDEVDGIWCAYLAWVWMHRRDRLRVYGDRAGGYVVAPSPPLRA
jgi:predicted RNase H-like nuclease